MLSSTTRSRVMKSHLAIVCLVCINLLVRADAAKTPDVETEKKEPRGDGGIVGSASGSALVSLCWHYTVTFSLYTHRPIGYAHRRSDMLARRRVSHRKRNALALSENTCVKKAIRAYEREEILIFFLQLRARVLLIVQKWNLILRYRYLQQVASQSRVVFSHKCKQTHWGNATIWTEHNDN